jgi:hypothetical protein
MITSFNFNPSRESKAVKKKQSLMTNEDREKQKLKNEIRKLRRQLFRKKKELQRIHLSLAQW